MSQQHTTAAPVSLEELLAHATWARRLARGLVADDRAAAEDTVQEALLAAVQRPPAPGGSLRGWLRQVLKRERASRVLSDRRRQTRERAAMAPAIAESPPSPEELAAALEVQRLLAGYVLALPEPFRQTLVLRYYEDRSSAEIAGLLDVPAGTVRWRLKEGLDRLRERLDRERGGAQAWRAALAPLAASGRTEPAASARPLPPWARVPAPVGIAAGVGAVALLGATAVLWTAPPRAPVSPRGTGAAAPAPGPTHPISAQEEDVMNAKELKRVATFIGIGLPALLASAAQRADPWAEDAVGVCLAAQEKSYECQKEVVDAWLALRQPPEKHRAPMRAKMLEELAKGGSDPLPVRRESCEKLVAGASAADRARLNDELLASMRACFARPDCQSRAACIAELIVGGVLPEVGPSGDGQARP
jgi:RNA polymerase sigma factor (sigma-70 family)